MKSLATNEYFCDCCGKVLTDDCIENKNMMRHYCLDCFAEIQNVKLIDDVRKR